jgi:DNA-binding XRE family transcriptional regulator
MRKIKVPRVLKINWINGLSISVVFNNGESRIIDFRKLLLDIDVKPDSAEGILFDTEEFSKVQLVDYTLSWNNVEQYMSLRNGEKQRVPYEIGPDVLLKYSKPERSISLIGIGKMVRDSRIRSGMSQQELALVSGTSRTYISRIENDRSDIELDTLRKIVETGLGRKLEIKIK